MPKRASQPKSLHVPKNPLAEVFGFTLKDKSKRALHFQADKLCPFNNIVPSCTKVSVLDPLGVCSLYDKDGQPTVVCPVRFKEDWLITRHAASFFFPPNTQWTAMTEIRLTDVQGKAAGNIDLVLVAYDNDGYVTDFGALEIQAVYISGNIRRPFRAYMKDLRQLTLDWSGQKEYPRADYLSSSRKRLAPQLIYKGGILHAWRKKMAVAVNRSYFESLPKFREVSSDKADIAWLIYDLVYNASQSRHSLTYLRTVHTRFEDVHANAVKLRTVDERDFVRQLESRMENISVCSC